MPDEMPPRPASGRNGGAPWLSRVAAGRMGRG